MAQNYTWKCKYWKPNETENERQRKTNAKIYHLFGFDTTINIVTTVTLHIPSSFVPPFCSLNVRACNISTSINNHIVMMTFYDYNFIVISSVWMFFFRSVVRSFVPVLLLHFESSRNLICVWNYYRFILQNKYIRIIDTKSIFTHENSILIWQTIRKKHTHNRTDIQRNKRQCWWGEEDRHNEKSKKKERPLGK